MRARRSSLSRFSHNPSTTALLLGLGAVFIAACSGADAPTSSTGPSSGIAVTDVPAPNAPNVTSRDEAGAPKFMWAARTANMAAIAGKPVDVARAHLARHADVLGISKKLAGSALVLHEQTLEGGASVMTFGQKIGDITVFRTRTSVIMDKGNRLVAITGNLRAAADSPAQIGRFALAPEDALAKAYANRFGITLPGGAIRETGMEKDGEYHDFEVATPSGAARIMANTARVRKIYYPQKGKLVAAYHVEFLARASGSKVNDGWRYAIAADDGRTLLRNSTTQHEKFTYRVWAEQGAASQHSIPLDSPLTDATPLPAIATPDQKEGPYVSSSLVTIDGFNKNPNGGVDPWLDANATVTTGNNVDAYTDRNSAENGTGDGFDEGIDLRANTTAERTFDRTYDPTKDPAVTQDQEKAAVTQLFYNTNWLHDYWYDSGFDEKSGNAQKSNYGRGGKEGDPLQAQAQDGADVGLSGNANMSTPSDGKSPTMQMYVWSGPSTHSLTATGGATFPDGLGTFGFGAPSFNVTGEVVYATPADGCTVPTNVSGKVALIDRGGCTFAVKVKNAQDGGAIAVLLANNAAGGPVSPSGDDATITIGGFGLSQDDGTALKAKLGVGTVTATLKATGGTVRDGDLDNTVVAHEWGHYLHHRLVDCGSPQCNGMSEGWADFDALMLTIKAGDNVQGTIFPMAQYASGSFEASQYFGIRRAPYSTDIKKFPFTFKFVRKDEDLNEIPADVPLGQGNSNNEAHAVGEIWAETLFEGYANLLAGVTATPPRFTFEQAKRRMADYVVAGMKATPVEPSFTDQRDAVLAVTFAKDQDDFNALAKGFAKRGLGVGAVSPPLDSDTLNEAVEDSSMKGNLKYLDATVNDAIRSCDRDGVLDGDEAGDVFIRLQNAGWLNIKNTTVDVTSTAAGVTFPKGTKATVVSLDPYGIAKIRITIALDPATAKQEFVPITVTLANADSLKTSVTGSIDPRANFDVQAASAVVDDVESATTPWTQLHALPDVSPSWSRLTKTDAMGKEILPPDTEWVGRDLGAGPGDESLVSPSLTVSATESFKISFKHRYSFEFTPASGPNGAVYFDGAVLEISKDDGATWEDISTYADPGYPHTLNGSSQGGGPDGQNPLDGKKAFSGEQAEYTTLSLDLGTQLASKTVKVRFRVGSDANTGAKGWEVDDIAFAGITNKPFSTLIDDASICKGVPIPVPGPAQTVAPGQTVQLDASGSSDPNGDPITFQWEELDGPDVVLADPTAAAKTTFVAPQVTEATKLTFRVTVADAHQAASDTVEITVVPPVDGGTGSDGGGDVGSPGTPGSSADDGCGCHTVGSAPSGNTGLLATALAGALAFIARGRRKKK